MNCCKHKYFVIYRGDSSDFPGNQELIIEIETERDLTGCSAHFQFQDYRIDFDSIPADKKLRLIFPSSETKKFTLGSSDAKLWLTYVTDAATKTRTVENRIHIVVTNNVSEAYDNDDPQAITVTIKGTDLTWENIKDKPNLVKSVNGKSPDENGNVDVTAIAEGAVQYDREQELTDAQKAQARSNIGAISEGDIPPAVTVDETVTRTSANPVKSSGIWSSIWGALAALPTGFSSLYDWCEAQLAALQSGKFDKTGGSIDSGDEMTSVKIGEHNSGELSLGIEEGVRLWNDGGGDGAAKFGYYLLGVQIFGSGYSEPGHSYITIDGRRVLCTGDAATPQELTAKRDLTDNTCHKTEGDTSWGADVALPEGMDDQPYYENVDNNRWFWEGTNCFYGSTTYGNPTATSLVFRKLSGIGPDTFNATKNTEVCTNDELYTTPTFINALINDVKAILGSVASGFSTFAEWIASKFDTSKAVQEFAATSTYEVGEIVLHDGSAYKCTTAIATAEAWTASHWTAATDSEIAARLKGFKADGSVTDKFATDLLGKQVAKEALSKGYAFFDLVPVTEGGFKVFAAKDHAINRFTLADATPVKVILPNATDANGRDFILKVNVTSATMPTFEIVKPSDAASVGIEAADDGWADLEAGINYFTITETDRA